MNSSFQELSPFLQSLYFRRKEVLIGAASVIAAIGILIVYFQMGPNANAYATAEMAYSKWNASSMDEELYSKMKEAIRKVPALEKKYEAAIAQSLLDGEKVDEAMAMAKRSLGRIKEDIPFHAAFAQNSLMIEQGAYQDALEKAVQLKERMLQAFNVEEFSGNRYAAGSLLYAHNLLRIACLHEKLNNRHGEKAAWEELEGLIQKQSIVSDLLLASFSEKQIDLNAFIAERKKHL